MSKTSVTLPQDLLYVQSHSTFSPTENFVSSEKFALEENSLMTLQPPPGSNWKGDLSCIGQSASTAGRGIFGATSAQSFPKCTRERKGRGDVFLPKKKNFSSFREDQNYGQLVENYLFNRNTSIWCAFSYMNELFYFIEKVKKCERHSCYILPFCLHS